MDAPTPESIRLNLSTFSIIRMKLRAMRLKENVRASSFKMDLWTIFIIGCTLIIRKSPLAPLCQRGVFSLPLEKGGEEGFYKKYPHDFRL
jgi:hypothetical protein